MTIAQYQAAIEAEATAVCCYPLDEATNKLGSLRDIIGSNDITLAGTEAGNFATTIDATVGLVGIEINGYAFYGGSPGTVTDAEAVSFWALLNTSSPSGTVRWFAAVEDGDNGMYGLAVDGRWDARHELSGTSESARTVDIYTDADGPVLVSMVHNGDSRTIYINGVAVDQSDQTSGIGSGGSSDNYTIGGNENQGQFAEGTIAWCTHYRGAGVSSIDWAAHYAAMYATGNRRRRLIIGAAA